MRYSWATVLLCLCSGAAGCSSDLLGQADVWVDCAKSVPYNGERITFVEMRKARGVSSSGVNYVIWEGTHSPKSSSCVRYSTAYLTLVLPDPPSIVPAGRAVGALGFDDSPAALLVTSAPVHLSRDTQTELRVRPIGTHVERLQPRQYLAGIDWARWMAVESRAMNGNWSGGIVRLRMSDLKASGRLEAEDILDTHWLVLLPDGSVSTVEKEWAKRVLSETRQ